MRTLFVTSLVLAPLVARAAPYEAVVTGSRTERRPGEAAAAVEVVTREQIAASGAQTLADVLETQPGVEVVRGFAGAGVRLQGLDPQYTLILIDGRRVIGRVGGTIDLSRYGVTDVERVEILKGAGAALYGADAIGGVINIITRRARRPVELDGRASYGSLNTAQLGARAGLRKGRLSTALSAGYRHRDAFALGPTAQTAGSALDDVDAGGRVDFRVRPSVLLHAAADFRRRDMRGVDVSAAGATFDRRNVTHLASVAAGADVTLASPTRLRATGSWSLFDDQFLQDQRGSSALDQLERSREQLVQLGLQVDRVVGGRFVLSGALEGTYQHLASGRLEGGVGHRGRGSAFLQADLTLARAPRLVLQPAARLDVDSQFGVRPSPSLTFRFDPHRMIAFRFTYGWGYRAPDFRELLLRFENPSAGYLVEGNPALEPETSQTLSLHAELRPTDGTALIGSVFRTTLEGLITTRPVADGPVQRFAYVNVAAATTQGAELQLRVQRGGLAIDLGYAFTDAVDESVRRPLIGRARHRGTAGVTWRHARLGAEATVRAAVHGPRPFYDAPDADIRWTATYATLDARVAKTLRGRFDLFLGGENLLDAGHPRDLPIPPRTVYGGVSGRY